MICPPSSNGIHFLRTLGYDPSILGGPTWHGSLIYARPFTTTRQWSMKGITDAVDMNLGKFLEMVMDRESWWCAAVRGVTKRWTQLGNWTITTTTWIDTYCTLVLVPNILDTLLHLMILLTIQYKNIDIFILQIGKLRYRGSQSLFQGYIASKW